MEKPKRRYANAEDFLYDARPAMEDTGRFILRNGLERKVAVDHISYKCSTRDEYEEIRHFFESGGCWNFETLISGRSVSTIRIRGDPLEHFRTVSGEVSILQLSDQKTDNSQTGQFDHVELYPTVDYDKLMKELKESYGLPINTVPREHHTTCDVVLPDSGLVIKFTRQRLVDKIRNEELV